MTGNNADFLTGQELARHGIENAEERKILIHRSCVIPNFSNLVFGGSHVRIDPFCVLTARKIVFGDHIHLATACTLTGGGEIHIGDFSGLSHGTRVFSSNDDYSGAYLTNPTVPSEYTKVETRNVTLGRHAIIGTNTVILPGAEVGDGASVGAQSLIKENLAPWKVYAGVPVKVIKDRKTRCLELEQELRKAGN